MKYILTAGTSYSDSEWRSHDDPDADSNFKKWPDLISEKLNLPVKNISKTGASNIYLYDKLMSNILENPEKIDLVVVEWTHGLKTSLYSQYDINNIYCEDHDPNFLEELNSFSKKLKEHIDKKELHIDCIEQTLRLICYLDDFCRMKQIPIIHFPLVNIFKTDTKQPDFFDRILNLKYFNRINNMNNVIGWPSDKKLGGYTFLSKYYNFVLSKKDMHPNSVGQKFIAEEIYNKYIEIYKGDPRDKNDIPC
jgi:hypothetical protein